MSGNRTEEPTPRRLREARRRGEVGASGELTAAAAFAGGLLALAIAGPSLARDLAARLRSALVRAPIEALDPRAVLADASSAVLTLSLPFCAGALAAAALAGALQARWNLSLEAVRPRLERVNPAGGLKRLLSTAQLAAAALALVKAAVLVAVAWTWVRGAGPALSGLARVEVPAIWRALPLLGSLAARLALAAALLGLADLGLARRRHRRALRMTRDEVRREQREDEGDPAHRAERRRRHRGLLEAGPISRATVVVVNPTHVAVALHHDRAGEDAPRVVAKGTGEAAARIRSAARRAGVPVVREVALARALHRLAEVGDEIPEELYEAAAAVLAHLYGREEIPA
ncbi:EscU/YscU/HrcU family type III secretion system export apparatus switch protein [Anaeromyxobacter oryzisoli]|uniref:EscU/YscU/HrcU family type III secretion system export apparatus switch protein n=1 Tax=Anaeromyxobacter oryzisoli TaxID=2925408 RepID=UPI001F56BC47|nr:EscU/YscU/HrcU family type III secretion system export apparatus switch protein [Anaeromyxobacter sp. SG63]